MRLATRSLWSEYACKNSSFVDGCFPSEQKAMRKYKLRDNAVIALKDIILYLKQETQ